MDHFLSKLLPLFVYPLGVAAFQALDVEVFPAPTDYEVVGKEYGILNWLPDIVLLCMPDGL